MRAGEGALRRVSRDSETEFGALADAVTRDPDLQTQHGTLRPTTTDDPVEARARIFCNRWSVSSDRVAMLVELRRLLQYALTREDDDDDPMVDESPVVDDRPREPDPTLF